jgi:hypothetical protein
MTYFAKVRNLVRGFSLDAALLSTLALPPFVLFGTLTDHAKPSLETESVSREISISDPATLIVTLGVNVKSLESISAFRSVRQK